MVKVFGPVPSYDSGDAASVRLLTAEEVEADRIDGIVRALEAKGYTRAEAIALVAGRS